MPAGRFAKSTDPIAAGRKFGELMAEVVWRCADPQLGELAVVVLVERLIQGDGGQFALGILFRPTLYPSFENLCNRFGRVALVQEVEHGGVVPLSDAIPSFE